jgi:membrane protein
MRAILFDIDGTLIDSNDAHVAAWEAAFSQAGHHIPTAAIRAQMGKGADNLVPTLLPGTDEATAERLGEAHAAFFRPMLETLQPFPHARDLLVRTRDAGLRVVLATSASQDELDHHLRTLDAHDIVHATTCADDVAHSKPAPDIFASALEKSGAAPDAVIVVGDTPYDIEAAGRAGLRAVAVRCGGFTDEDLAAAAAIYDGPEALLAGFESSPLAP